LGFGVAANAVGVEIVSKGASSSAFGDELASKFFRGFLPLDFGATTNVVCLKPWLAVPAMVLPSWSFMERPPGLDAIGEVH